MIERIPDELTWRDTYKLLVGAVVPRPIAFVSTISRTGQRNLAAFSFFNAVCPKPLIVSFAPMFRGTDGARKDTLTNIEETGQFVVNVVTEEIVAQMNLTAPEFAPEVDEFEVSGLTPVPSVVVVPPRVGESPVQMECERVEVLQFGDEQGGGFLVLGKVLRMHIADAVYQDGKIDPDALRAVGRMAGSDYTCTRDRFTLPRPQLPR